MFCTKCGKEIAPNVACCPNCGSPIGTPGSIPPPAPIIIQQQPKTGCGKKLGCAFLIVLGMSVFAGIVGNAAKTSNDTSGNVATPVPPRESSRIPSTSVSTQTPAIPQEFTGECGITASAHLQSDRYINHPHLSIAIRNVSGKNIAAIQFLAVPYDVYGENLSSSFFAQERLQTDDLIPAGRSKELNFGPFLDQQIKSVKLYVYSVYFDDGTEWGDKDATRSMILRYGKPIEATFER